VTAVKASIVPIVIPVVDVFNVITLLVIEPPETYGWSNKVVIVKPPSSTTVKPGPPLKLILLPL